MCTLAEPTTIPIGALQPNPSMGPPLYMGTIGGGVVAYVNGQLVRLKNEGDFTSRVIVFRYHDRLYAAGTDQLEVMNGWASGASPTSTSFTAVSLPVALAGMRMMCALEWAGYAFLGGSLPGGGGTGAMVRISDATGSPLTTEVTTGIVGAISYDDFALALDSAFACYRHQPISTEAADFSEMSSSGTLGAGLSSDLWSEDGMIPRMLGTREGLYLTAWGGTPVNALYNWDGTTLTKLSDIVEQTAVEYAPYDMVGF
jgi:hypothetical protein